MSWREIVGAFWPLALVPIVLIGLTLWMRRYVLRSAAADADAAWFSYARFMKFSAQAGWLIWLGLLSLPAVGRWVAFVAVDPGTRGTFGAQALIWTAIGLLPMALTTIVCRVLSFPVFAQVHGSQWTRGEIFRQAFWTQATFVVPILCFVGGITKTGEENWRGVVFFMLLGFAILIFGIRQIAVESGRTSESLSTGELRNRVFALAANSGVRLKSLYVISSAKSRMANAFAAQGNTVMLTDYLLTHLTRREVDAVVAHELTHLKKQHVALRMIIFVAVAFTSVAIMQDWMRAGLIPLLAAILLLIFYLTRRVNERTADAGAVKILGDPEAMITGLAKITRLNKFPLRWSKWSEWLMTHPSTMRRAEAIARKTGIAPERLAQILEAGTTGDSYYTLPAAIAGGAKVYSTKYKKSQAAKRSWTFVAIMTVGPAAILGIAKAAGFEGAATLGAWIFSIAATFGLYLAAMNYFSLSGNEQLEKRLRARLKSENKIAREDGGMFVGFAPDAAPRLYDGGFSWDMGLLFFGAEQVVYFGEETRFGLRRGEILDARDVRGSPAWIRTGAVLIQWRDAAKDLGGAFLIRPQRARSLAEQREVAEELTTRLEEWIDGRQQGSDELPLGDFETPEVGAVTSVSPGQTGRGKSATRSVMILGYISAAAAVLCNLSFIGPFDGWYAVSATIILGIVQFIPYWRDRQEGSAARVV